jgi:DNA-binding response OmpR family regulator
MATVLPVGEDEILLNTRAAVVRTTGASTVCSLTTSALALLAEQGCDLVILCHSVPDYVCTTLAEIIRCQWPGTRILRLAAGSAWEEDGSVAVCSADPESLVQRTVELLGRRGPQRVPPAASDAAFRERFYR